MDPALKPMFKGDIKEQGEKLMKMGVKHLDYGVKNSHYDTVGAALLWTLGQGLGEAFTPEVKSAWTDVYGLLATTMKDAAREAA